MNQLVKYLVTKWKNVLENAGSVSVLETQVLVLVDFTADCLNFMQFYWYYCV